MQFAAHQPIFKRGLTVVSHAVPSRTTRPIERYILATTDQGRIRLSARREDMGIHYWIDASHIEGEGAMLLPAHLMTDFVSNVPIAPVRVTSPSPTSANACHVQCLRSTADMKNASDDPAEFPQIPTFADGGERLMQLDAELLKEIIAATAFAADKDTSHWPWAVGMKVEISEGTAKFLATDSFRLAMHTIPVPDDQLRCSLLIPAKTMEELAKMLPQEGSVQMMLTPNRNMVLFHVETADRAESVDISTRLLSDIFPPLHTAIPETWTTRAVMNTQELSAAMRLMLPFAEGNKYKIHFSLYGEQQERTSLLQTPHTMALETTGQDVGHSQNVVVAQVQGPDQDIYLHGRYLLDVISALTTTEVALEVTERRRPVVIRPVGPSRYVHLIMPQQEDQAATVTVQSNGHVPITSR